MIAHRLRHAACGGKTVICQGQKARLPPIRPGLQLHVAAQVRADSGAGGQNGHRRSRGPDSESANVWRSTEFLLAAAALLAMMAQQRQQCNAQTQGQDQLQKRHAALKLRLTTAGKDRIKDKYEIGEMLGEGGYGTVHTATEKRTGKPVAVKKIKKKIMQKDEFKKELHALQKIKEAGGHPNIAGAEEIFQDNQFFYLVMELISGGEMFEHLINNGAYSEQTAAALVKDLGSGLDFLHRQHLVHADLKPENLMLSTRNSDDAHLKLVDFGCAGAEGNTADVRAMGTTAYWPPEAIKAKRGFALTPAMDMWAVGVILFIMLTGAHPYDLNGQTPENQIMRNVISKPAPLDDALASHLSDSAKDLIRGLLEKDPKKRLTAQQMMQHPWVKGETASPEIMENIDEKLTHFQEVLKAKLEGGLFALLIQQSAHDGAVVGQFSSPVDNVEQAVDVVKKAFQAFDQNKKGFVSAEDIARVLVETGEGTLSVEEAAELAQAMRSPSTNKDAANSHGKGISINSLEDMLSGLESKTYKPGEYIFREGEAADYMYFINSGKVDIIAEDMDGTRGGPTRITTLTAGAMFGEAAMLTNEPRSASVRCNSPVQVVRIGKALMDRMMKEAKSTSATLREIAILREMNRAKAVLRAVGRVTSKKVPLGEAVVKQGEMGDSMYTIVSGEMDVVVDGTKHVAKLSPGDMFGEMALMLKQPRNASVVCTSLSNKDDMCVLNEIKGDDFLDLLKQSPDFHKSMRRLLRTRLFRQDILKLSKEDSTGQYTNAELRQAFDQVDADHSGVIEINELMTALKRMNSKLTEDDIREVMRMGDLDQDGFISFSEFIRIMNWEAASKPH